MLSESFEILLQKIAPGSIQTAVQSMPGNFSNDTRLLEARSAAGEELRFVVRRYAQAGQEGAAKARREFEVLRLLAAQGVPTPQPLYLDEQGTLLERPGIVMSFVSGKQLCNPADPLEWARKLAVVLAKIHSIPCNVSEADYLLDGNEAVVWFLSSGVVPSYMSEHPDGAAVWQAVHDLLPRYHPVAPALTHIDYWSGNILWGGDEITGVLDWEEAACGDPVYDVAYCRMEMTLLGMEEAADHFLRVYQMESGRQLENLPLWELAVVARSLPDPAGWISEWEVLGKTGLTAEGVRQRLRQFIAEAKQRAALE